MEISLKIEKYRFFDQEPLGQMTIQGLWRAVPSLIDEAGKEHKSRLKSGVYEFEETLEIEFSSEENKVAAAVLWATFIEGKDYDFYDSLNIVANAAMEECEEAYEAALATVTGPVKEQTKAVLHDVYVAVVAWRDNKRAYIEDS